MSWDDARGSEKLSDELTDERPPVQLLYGLPKKQMQIAGGVTFAMTVVMLVIMLSSDPAVSCPLAEEDDHSCPFFPGSRIVNPEEAQTINSWVAEAERTRGRWNRITWPDIPEQMDKSCQAVHEAVCGEVIRSGSACSYACQQSPARGGCTGSCGYNPTRCGVAGPGSGNCNYTAPTAAVEESCTAAAAPRCAAVPFDGMETACGLVDGCVFVPATRYWPVHVAADPLAGVQIATWTLCYSTYDPVEGQDGAGGEDHEGEAPDFHAMCDKYARTVVLASNEQRDGFLRNQWAFGGYVSPADSFPPSCPPARLFPSSIFTNFPGKFRERLPLTAVLMSCVQASSSWDFRKCCADQEMNRCEDPNPANPLHGCDFD